MKVRYLCDCCDCFFEGADYDEDETAPGSQALTELTGGDIIKQDGEGQILVTRTCDECNSVIGLDQGDLVFYRQPIIN